MILAFLPALGTVPIHAADASPMEVTFVNAPNEAEAADEAATPSDAIFYKCHRVGLLL